MRSERDRCLPLNLGEALSIPGTSSVASTCSVELTAAVVVAAGGTQPEGLCSTCELVVIGGTDGRLYLLSSSKSLVKTYVVHSQGLQMDDTDESASCEPLLDRIQCVQAVVFPDDNTDAISSNLQIVVCGFRGKATVAVVLRIDFTAEFFKGLSAAASGPHSALRVTAAMQRSELLLARELRSMELPAGTHPLRLFHHSLLSTPAKDSKAYLLLSFLSSEGEGVAVITLRNDSSADGAVCPPMIRSTFDDASLCGAPLALLICASVKKLKLSCPNCFHVWGSALTGDVYVAFGLVDGTVVLLRHTKGEIGTVFLHRLAGPIADVKFFLPRAVRSSLLPLRLMQKIDMLGGGGLLNDNAHATDDAIRLVALDTAGKVVIFSNFLSLHETPVDDFARTRTVPHVTAVRDFTLAFAEAKSSATSAKQAPEKDDCINSQRHASQAASPPQPSATKEAGTEQLNRRSSNVFVGFHFALGLQNRFHSLIKMVQQSRHPVGSGPLQCSSDTPRMPSLDVAFSSSLPSNDPLSFDAAPTSIKETQSQRDGVDLECCGTVLSQGPLSIFVGDVYCRGWNDLVVTTMGRLIAVCKFDPISAQYYVDEVTVAPTHLFFCRLVRLFGSKGGYTWVMAGPGHVLVNSIGREREESVTSRAHLLWKVLVAGSQDNTNCSAAVEEVDT